MVLQLHEYLRRCLSDIHTSPHQRKRPRIMVQVYIYVDLYIGPFLQVALVSTALAAIGWVVFLGGFGFLTTNR